jgi:rhodanese-related sulfurtransferase
MYEVGMVVLITMTLSSAAYVFRPHALPLWPSGGVDSLPEENQHLYSTISIDDAIDLFDQQAAVFVDARPLELFIEGHIQDAIHLDPYQFDVWAESLIERIPPETTIITYCAGEHCSLSAELAEKLIWLGYEQVFYLEDGWGRWKRRRLPVAQGEQS